ncbi:hypothetical protein [Skermania sp. ID1734]
MDAAALVVLDEDVVPDELLLSLEQAVIVSAPTIAIPATKTRPVFPSFN